MQLAGFRDSRTRLPFSSPTPAPLQPLNSIQAALILTGVITPSQPDCNQARLRHQGTEKEPNPEPVTASPTSEDTCRGTQHAFQGSLVRPPPGLPNERCKGRSTGEPYPLRDLCKRLPKA